MMFSVLAITIHQLLETAPKDNSIQLSGSSKARIRDLIEDLLVCLKLQIQTQTHHVLTQWAQTFALIMPLL